MPDHAGRMEVARGTGARIDPRRPACPDAGVPLFSP